MANRASVVVEGQDLPTPLDPTDFTVIGGYVHAAGAGAYPASTANTPVVATVPLRDPADNGSFEVGGIEFDQAFPSTVGVGKLTWNSTQGTLDLGLQGGNVVVQLGQENVLKVRNEEVTPLVDGEVVYIYGSSGTHNSVKRASALTEGTSANTIGVVTEPIGAHPGEGFITTFGMVTCDTNHLIEGAAVWLSTVSGQTTSTKPTAPNHLVLIGFCVKKAGPVDGRIFVSVNNGYELSELHDVYINAISNGDILQWVAANNRWQNVSLASGPFVLKTGDTMTGDLTINNNKSLIMSQAAIFNLTRTIPIIVGNYVELGSITNIDFAGNVEIWYNAHNNNFSQSKRYFLPLSYNATAGAWQKLLPFSTTGQYAGNDADLEINVTLGVAYFRIRRTAGTTAGVADVVFLLGGSADETTWTPLTGTGAAVSPTAFYQVKAEGTNSDFVGAGLSSIPFINRSLLQAGNFPATIGTYSLASWNATGNKVPLFSACPTNNGGNVPVAGQPALVLGRDGVNGQAYGNMAEFKLRRYEVSSVNARTQLDIALTHGAAATAGTDVLGMRSNGDVLVTAGNLVVPKTVGTGIKVDTTTPTFGWRDMLGEIVARGTGASNPTWSAFRGGIYGYQFQSATINEVWTNFHVPHDWIPGTDLYAHVHWSQNIVDTGGPAGVPGSAKWYFELTYADGYGTPGGAGDPFFAPITVSVVQQASTTQYAHMIAEVRCGTAGGAGGTELNTSTIAVDGLILCRLWRDKTDPADTLDQGPFIHMCDIHYQTNGVLGTKDKNPPFYT